MSTSQHDHQPHPAALFLRSCCAGLLTAQDEMQTTLRESVKFIIDPASGRIVLPLPPLLAGHTPLVLHCPEDSFENDQALHLLASPETIDPKADAIAERAVDRYLIYIAPSLHNPRVQWVQLTPITAKFRLEMAEAHELMLSNPFADTQDRLCSTVNKQPEALATLRARAGFTDVQIPNPKLVGIDPWGADFRASFGIVRLDLAPPAPANADEALQRLLAGA